MTGAPEPEHGWLPDYLYREGRLETGVAMFANARGTITRFSSDAADLARAERLAGRAIFPGLINAHSHAFQRAIRGRTEHRSGAAHDSFWTWREAMYQAAGRLSPDGIFDISRMAFAEMLSAGITAVGEFHYLHHAHDGTPYDDRNLLAREVIRAAQEVGLRINLLRSAYFRSGWQQAPHARQARFLSANAQEFLTDTEALASKIETLREQERAWVGVAPHSVRAVPLPFLIEIAAFARQHHLPVHMHVAEQPAEVEACLVEHGRRPIELLHEHGLLHSGFTAVHATQATAEEIGYLAPANICVCPTTERNLGDGIAPADRWRERRISTCLGSDSNIQIDLLEDARELEYHLRLKRLQRAILPAQALFEFATEGGARSLRTPGGTLAVNKPADFFCLDLNHASIAGTDRDTLLSNVVFAATPGAVRDVYIGGKGVLLNRSQRNEDEIRTRFRAAMQRLWVD